jgi:hypothetical protein
MIGCTRQGARRRLHIRQTRPCPLSLNIDITRRQPPPDPGFFCFDAVANVAGRLPKDWTNAKSRRRAAPPSRHGLPLNPNNITCHRTLWTDYTLDYNDNLNQRQHWRSTLLPDDY